MNIEALLTTPVKNKNMASKHDWILNLCSTDKILFNEDYIGRIQSSLYKIMDLLKSNNESSNNGKSISYSSSHYDSPIQLTKNQLFNKDDFEPFYNKTMMQDSEIQISKIDEPVGEIEGTIAYNKEKNHYLIIIHKDHSNKFKGYLNEYIEGNYDNFECLKDEGKKIIEAQERMNSPIISDLKLFYDNLIIINNKDRRIISAYLYTSILNTHIELNPCNDLPKGYEKHALFHIHDDGSPPSAEDLKNKGMKFLFSINKNNELKIYQYVPKFVREIEKKHNLNIDNIEDVIPFVENLFNSGKIYK